MLHGGTIPATPGKNDIEAISIDLSCKFLLFQVIFYELTRKYHTYLIDSQYSMYLLKK